MPDLQDGESVEVQGSAKAPYVIRNTGGVYACSCPAWRNQSLGIEQRTCKHIRKLRGDDAEKERIGDALPAKRASKAKQAGPPLLLAHRWENDVDLSDWWMSEKLDGVRAYWDGQRFLSRQGNEFHAPDWFVDGLPGTQLDGELWMDRKAFQRTVSIVRRQDRSDHWKQIKYVVFDAPALTDPFEERIRAVEECVAGVGSEFVQALSHARCQSLAHLREELARIESLGGEGLMLREPGSQYEIGRSMSLLKVKTFHDADAVVIDHVAGKGRHKGRMGALLVQLKDGTEFSVGTGFTDKQREAPPEPGSTITFRYQEFSDGGVPRFPSFVRAGSDGGSKSASTDKQATQKSRSTKKSSTTTRSAKVRSTPASAKQPTPATHSDDNSACRYFEYTDASSSKFWEISRDGNDVTVRYGRIGTDGQTRTKTLADDTKAEAHADKLIEQKTSKGYTESQSS